MMRTWLAGALMLAGCAWAGAAAAAGEDLYGDPLPEGAVSRLGSVRFRGGDGDVKGLHFSADGRALLTVGEQFTLRLWETSTGRLLREARPGTVSIHALAVSPDGRQIALEGSRRIEGDPGGYEQVRQIFDAASGKELRRLPPADRGDHAMAFTPDGKLLMTVGGEGTLRIEEVASGAELCILYASS